MLQAVDLRIWGLWKTNSNSDQEATVFVSNQKSQNSVEGFYLLVWQGKILVMNGQLTFCDSARVMRLNKNVWCHNVNC